MATNKTSDKSHTVSRGKLFRINIREQRHDRLNYQSSHVTTNNSAKVKNIPGDENSFIIPELLCQCQQKCTERVTAPLIQKISMYFFGLRNDREKQYKYLADLILSKEKKIDLVDIVPGKRLRKMSFRYFVPILTDDDLKLQLDEKKINRMGDLMWNRDKDFQNNIIKEDGEIKSPKRDHIEVCLKAFTNIHLISEKRVNITRSTCKLKNIIYCTRPFSIHVSSLANHVKSTITNKSPPIQPTIVENIAFAGPSDISLAAAAWLSNHCQQKKPAYAINPKTLLPEGLVLPDSVTCLPVYPKPQYDLNRDTLIVDNFFHNQLWKPEYTGGLQEK